MPKLCIEDYNDNIHYSVIYDAVHKEFFFGSRRYIEITDEEAELALEALGKKYNPETKEVEVKEQPPPKPDKEKEQKKSDLEHILSRIIRESHHEGEIRNAKELYQKLTGREYGQRLDP